MAQAQRRQQRRPRRSKPNEKDLAGCTCPRGARRDPAGDLAAGLFLAADPMCPRLDDHVAEAQANRRVRLLDSARFDALRAELLRRKHADGAGVLSPGELAVVLEALALAGDYGPLRVAHDELLARDLRAFSALSNDDKDANSRARVFLNRMVGKPDRSAVARPPRFDARQVVADYRALTGQSEPGDVLERYDSRKRCGLPNLTHKPRPWCARHTTVAQLSAPERRVLEEERERCERCNDPERRDPIEPLVLPLTRAEAVIAVKTVHQFASPASCAKFLEREKVADVPSMREKAAPRPDLRQ